MLRATPYPRRAVVCESRWKRKRVDSRVAASMADSSGRAEFAGSATQVFGAEVRGCGSTAFFGCGCVATAEPAWCVDAAFAQGDE